MEDLTPNDFALMAMRNKVAGDDETGFADSVGGLGGPTTNDITDAIEDVNDSAAVKRGLQCAVFYWTTAITMGTGKFYLHIDNRIGGMSLTDVHARVITPGSGGTTNFNIINQTRGVSMLSNSLSIDADETGSDTATTPVVIHSLYKTVATNDVIRIDVTSIPGTPPRGLIITLGFSN